MSHLEARSSLARAVRRHWALLLVLCVALVARVWGLTEWWLNPDEGIYYSILTRRDLAAFWNELASNAHPPLYYVLLRVIALFTWSFVSFRMLSILCGVAAVVGAWAVGRELGGPGTRGLVAGLLSALVMALSPAGIALSGVMRPYMLQLALLTGALFYLLRYQRAPSSPNLTFYVAFLVLALLTHYSSLLALGALLVVVFHDGVERGFDRPEWKRLTLWHAAPIAVAGLLYSLHLRRLAASPLADDALRGWLSFYMVDSPSTGWLGFLGYHGLVVPGWIRAPTALLLIVSAVVAVLTRHRRPAVLAAAALVTGLGAAVAHVYPFGATRHTIWMMAFTVPVLGWLGGWVASLPRPKAAAWTGGVLVLFVCGGPLGRVLGADRAPWAPSEHVLRRRDLTLMVDLLDPYAKPDVIVMSAQTFYLLLPFYPVEREDAVFAPDGSVFDFPYGDRQIVVAQSWDLTASRDVDDPAHLAAVLHDAEDAFPTFSIEQHPSAVLFVGGWRPSLIDELARLSGGPRSLVVRDTYVPGLFAFLLNLEALGRTFPSSPAP